jgi:hypothetical protein
LEKAHFIFYMTTTATSAHTLLLTVAQMIWNDNCGSLREVNLKFTITFMIVSLNIKSSSRLKEMILALNPVVLIFWHKTFPHRLLSRSALVWCWASFCGAAVHALAFE